MAKKTQSGESKKDGKKRKRKAIGLEHRVHRPIRRELVDYDYVDKLNEDQKDWLHRFTEEEVAANLKHEGQKFNKTEKEKKRIWKKNNDRNACQYSRAKAVNKVQDLNDLADLKINPEDAIVELIDLKLSFESEFGDELDNFKSADNGSNKSRSKRAKKT